MSEILEAEQRIASVFRFVATFGSPILIGSLIILGSAFTYYSLFFFRARVRPGSSFLGGSPIRTRPLLIIAHRGISTAENHIGWVQTIEGCTPAKAAREGLANQALGADRFRGFLKREIRDWIAPMERFIF